VGRDHELALLAEAWDGARARHHGGVVVLAGEAGIGKSRLAAAVAEIAATQQALVMRGRAVSIVPPAAFRPLAEALCEAVRTVGLPEAAELQPFHGTLGRLVPEWHATARGGTDHSMVMLGEAMLRFLRVVAGDRGCLLILEDLHWADPETLEIVEYLADNLRAERVLCVVTMRDDEGGAGPVRARELAARRACALITLPRLAPIQVAEMVGDCLGVESVPQSVLELAERSEGIPFLVEALLTAAAATGGLRHSPGGWHVPDTSRAVVPVSLVDSVRRRLAVLDALVQQVLRAAAVLGAFDTDLLAATIDTDEAGVVVGLRTAAGSGLVVVDGDPPAFRFRHALIRDAVGAQLFPPERAALSRRALTALTEGRPGLPGAWGEIAAELAWRAGVPTRAAWLWREVGRRALDAGALTSAEATLGRARSMAAGDDEALVAIEEDLVEVLALAGNHSRAAEVGAVLLDRLATAPGARDRRAVVRLQLARAAAATGSWGQAREQVRAARAEASAADGALTCRLDALDAVIAQGEDNADQARRFAERAVAGAEREQLPEVACEALEVLGRCARPRDLDAAEAAFVRARDTAVQHGLQVWQVHALHELGIIDLLRDAETRRLVQARDLAVEIGALTIHATIELHLCAALFLHGQDGPCRDAALRTAELARRYGMRHTAAVALGFLATVHARAGRTNAVEETLAEAAGYAEGDASFPGMAAVARAMLAFVADDRTMALRQLGSPAARDSAQVRNQNPAAGLRALLCAVDAEQAEVAIAEARDGGEPVNCVTRGFLHYADAVVHGRAGRTAEAVAAVAAGDRALEPLRWLRHFGRRWVADAALADRWGRPEVWLREAEDFFSDADQPRLAAACRSLMRRAGVPLRRRRDGDAVLPVSLRGFGITAREHQVMALLAEGLPNSLIAQRLYLSPRTVERHIANISAKVGVDRRAQLVAFSARNLNS
jgi:DNA-binding CsgD family transcriptional regulator